LKRATRTPGERQQIEVTGTVTGENNEPLPAVSIAVKGTPVRAVSDAEGKFRINVPNETSILMFSLLGYTSRQIIVADRTTLHVTLKEENTEISEVVVTALGIKREEKALGYSISTIKGEQLTDALSNNWTDALS